MDKEKKKEKAKTISLDRVLAFNSGIDVWGIFCALLPSLCRPVSMEGGLLFGGSEVLVALQVAYLPVCFPFS